MKIHVRYIAIIILCSTIVFSCKKNSIIDTGISNPEPCQLDLTDSIKIDSIWAIPFKNLGDVIYSDKYFYIRNDDYYTANVYSVETGELVCTIDEKQLCDGFIFNMQIVGDYAYSYNLGLDKTVYKYNIKTSHFTKSTKNIPLFLSVVYKENYFYAVNFNNLSKYDYNGEVLDTFPLQYDNYLDFVTLKTYQYPYPVDKEYFILTYIDDLGIFYFKLIDSSNGKTIKTLRFSSGKGSFFLDFYANYETVTCEKLLFCYDFTTDKYYIANNPELPEKQSIFFALGQVLTITNDNLTAFDIKKGSLTWSCESPIYTKINNIDPNFYPINLADNFQSNPGYFVFSGNGKIYVAEALTGIIKAEKKVGLTYLKNISPIYNGNELIARTQQELIKYKITNK